jgi:dipeptidyl aminopeptidase/acylaminoacyl peptidase
MKFLKLSLVIASTLVLAPFQIQAAERTHLLTLDAIAGLHAINHLQCSADGAWAAYDVSSHNQKDDKRRTTIWMVNLLQGDAVRLTPEAENSSNPVFSPNGRYIAFLSKRGKQAHRQVYLLDRRGGEAQAITELEGEIGEIAWSPKSDQLALTMSDPPNDDEHASGEEDKPKPIVIDGYKFKEDMVGFQTKADHEHLYLFTLETKKLVRLTQASFFDDQHLAWSPDTQEIAFVSNHTDDPAAPATQWLYIIAAQEGAGPRLIAKIPSESAQKLVWTDDAKQLVHLSGFEPKFNQYNQARLAITTIADGQTRVLSTALDRPVSDPVKLGRNKIGFLVADDRRDYAAAIDLATGKIKRITDDIFAIADQCGGANARAVIASADGVPSEVLRLDGAELHAISAHNRPIAETIKWGAVTDFAATSRDGTDVHGLMFTPPDFRNDRTYPTIACIHGGPNSQDNHALTAESNNLIRQWLATHDYVILAVNYRGGSGRGDAYARAIAADWGNKEVDDIEAAIDWAIARGIADKNRLGVGGWSYGGILTNYSIYRDQRFKAAVSGAGVSNLFGLFGVDQYILQYIEELGAPWRQDELYRNLSAPFFHADRIKTPTLFMGGTSDENVPLIGGMQMYQALKVEGVPTQLIAYPGEYHGLKRPSFLRDRLERLVEWYDRYLKDSASPDPK